MADLGGRTGEEEGDREADLDRDLDLDLDLDLDGDLALLEVLLGMMKRSGEVEVEL